MRKHREVFVLLFVGLLLFGSPAYVMASQEIILEEESIQAMRKSVAKAEPFFYVDINWEITLQNPTDQSRVTTITLTLLDEDNVPVGKTSVSREAGAGERVRVSDTLTLRRRDARKISSGIVTLSQ